MRYDFSSVSLAGAQRHGHAEVGTASPVATACRMQFPVWQDGAACTDGTFLVSAISEHTAIFEFDNQAYTVSSLAGSTRTALLTARGA
ncbi:MAG: hypothetical protein R3F46_00250 [bacterium]